MVIEHITPFLKCVFWYNCVSYILSILKIIVIYFLIFGWNSIFFYLPVYDDYDGGGIVLLPVYDDYDDYS